MLKRVCSIDEAVLLVQSGLAAADHKYVADYAWNRTPVSSTRVLLYTPTPYVKNQEQLDDVCANTNINASMTSKHNVMVSFDPSESVESTTTVQPVKPVQPVINWYQVMQEETQRLKADNERLKTENERLKADAEEEKLYWMDQINITETRCNKYVEDLKEQLQGCQQELVREQALVKYLQTESTFEKRDLPNGSNGNVSVRSSVDTKAFRDVYDQMIEFMKQSYDKSVENSAILLLGIAGEPFDASMSLHQLLHRIGEVMASVESEKRDLLTQELRVSSIRSKHLHRAIRLALKSLNKKMDPEVLAHYRAMVNELTE